MTSAEPRSITKERVFEQLQTAVREFFDCPDEEIFPDTVAFDIDGWDSLAHATFMLDLESRFSIRFEGTEVLEFENVGNMVDCIYGHLVSGSIHHEGVVPQIERKVNDLDPRYRTLIFNFNNSQVIKASEENGFWRELEKKGYSETSDQCSKVDWASNSIRLPIKCNPKDILGFQVQWEGVQGRELETVSAVVNGIPCPPEPQNNPGFILFKFQARDYLDMHALEGPNTFELSFASEGEPLNGISLKFFSVKCVRWAETYSGTINGKTYLGDNLWNDLWRVGSRNYLMQMNASFHGKDGVSGEQTIFHAIGDSHAVFDYAVYPECQTHYVDGQSIFHLIKNPFDISRYTIPKGAKTTFVFGEIDCRTIIGSLADRIPPADLCQYLADKYGETINAICKPKELEVAITLPAPPFAKNVAADDLFPVVGSLQERAEYTRLLCDALRSLKGNGCITGIIDAYTPYANEEGLLDRFFAADEAHLRPDRTDPLFAQAKAWAGGLENKVHKRKDFETGKSGVEKTPAEGASKSAREQDLKHESEALVAQAIELKKKGNISEATQKFLKVLETDPGNALAITNLIPPVEMNDPVSRRSQRDQISKLSEISRKINSSVLNDVIIGLLMRQVEMCEDLDLHAEAAQIYGLAASFSHEYPDKRKMLKALQSFYAEPAPKIIGSDKEGFSGFRSLSEETEPVYISARLSTVSQEPAVKVKSIEDARNFPATAVPIEGIEQLEYGNQFEAPPYFLAEMSPAMVTDNFMVLSEAGNLIREDFTPFTIYRDSPNRITAIYNEIRKLQANAVLLRTQGNVERIDEPCILISGGPNGATNYYHWMLDYLPRLLLTERDTNLSKLKIVINAGLSSFQKQSLEVLGIDQSRIIFKEPEAWLLCEHLYVPSFISRTGCAHPEAVEFLRRKFLPKIDTDKGTGPKRVYLSRKDSKNRTIINEREVEDVLRQEGFEIVVPGQLSILDQVRMMSAAEKIVVAHGAGLVNLVFAPPGADVLELMTKKHTAGLSIASCMRQPYRNLDAIPADLEHQETHVSISDLRMALADMLS